MCFLILDIDSTSIKKINSYIYFLNYLFLINFVTNKGQFVYLIKICKNLLPMSTNNSYSTVEKGTKYTPEYTVYITNKDITIP